jgi:hypothetical protein
MPTKRGIKTMYIQSEHVDARRWIAPSDPDDLDRLMMTNKAKGGGCYWEFTIRLERLSGKASMKIEAWNDAWIAFKEAPEVFEILAKYQREGREDDAPLWPKLIEDLKKAGWKHEKPEPVESRIKHKCPACGKAKE